MLLYTRFRVYLKKKNCQLFSTNGAYADFIDNNFFFYNFFFYYFVIMHKTKSNKHHHKETCKIRSQSNTIYTNQ